MKSITITIPFRIILYRYYQFIECQYMTTDEYVSAMRYPPDSSKPAGFHTYHARKKQSSAAPEFSGRAFESGADVFASKPVDLDLLKKKVQQLIDHQ